MDSKNLITFIALSKSGSYIKTAAKLNYAQSTLYDHIKVLETELETKLVEKYDNNIVLTKHGKIFLDYAIKIIDLCENARKELSNNALSIHIASSESLGMFFLTDVMKKFCQENSNVGVSLTLGDSHIFFEGIKNNDIDVAYMWSTKPLTIDEHSIFIFKSPLVFVANPNHKLAKRELIKQNDFENQLLYISMKSPQYKKNIFTILFPDNDINFKSIINMDGIYILKEFVKKSNSIALLPIIALQKELDEGSLIKLNYKENMAYFYANIVYRKNKWISPELLSFINLSVSPEFISKLDCNIN